MWLVTSWVMAGLAGVLLFAALWYQFVLTDTPRLRLSHVARAVGWGVTVIGFGATVMFPIISGGWRWLLAGLVWAVLLCLGGREPRPS